MNWKITRPQKAVKFERDGPIWMIMPVRREDVESFQHYIRGESGSGERVSEHQTKLAIRAFTELEPAVVLPSSAAAAPAQQETNLLRKLLRG